MGLMTLLAPAPYLLSAEEALATKSDDDSNHDKKDKANNKIPSAYISTDGELSELQIENKDDSSDDRDPQETISFG